MGIGEEGMATGLFIVPGGFKNVVTAAMLAAFKEEGELEKFDYVVGCSSGAANLLYFTHPNLIGAVTSFWSRVRPIVQRQNNFSFSRVLTGKFPVDVKSFIDDVYFSEEGFPPHENFLTHPINREGRLLITCFDVITGQPVYLGKFQTQDALKQALYGSCYLPLFNSLEPHTINKKYLDSMSVFDHLGKEVKPDTLKVFDGALYDYYGAHAAQIFNIEKRIHLDYVPKSTYGSDCFSPLGKRLRRVEPYVVKMLFHKYPNGLSRYLDMVPYNTGLQRMAFELKRQDEEDENVQIIAPENSVGFRFGERRIAKLKSAAQVGWKTAYLHMGRKMKPIPDEWL